MSSDELLQCTGREYYMFLSRTKMSPIGLIDSFYQPICLLQINVNVNKFVVFKATKKIEG